MNLLTKEKTRDIPSKNYVYLSLIILGTILILAYIYTWYKTYNQNKLNTTIMNNYLAVINYNEIDDYITENKDAIIYVSILGNEEINRFEEKFKNNILDNNLKNALLYLDLTNEDQTFATNKLNIGTNFPYLVVYTNGKITNTYSIADNNYNPHKAIKYLNRMGVGEND